jgi:hypothetical protein
VSRSPLFAVRRALPLVAASCARGAQLFFLISTPVPPLSVVMLSLAPPVALSFTSLALLSFVSGALLSFVSGALLPVVCGALLSFVSLTLLLFVPPALPAGIDGPTGGAAGRTALPGRVGGGPREAGVAWLGDDGRCAYQRRRAASECDRCRQTPAWALRRRMFGVVAHHRQACADQLTRTACPRTCASA